MVNVLYFYAMIMSIVLIYIIGDISKILRNILAIFIFLYSLISTVFVNEAGFTINVMKSMNLNMSFSYSGIGTFFVILNHIAFGVILINILNNTNKKRDNGFLFNMFLIFYLTTLLFMSSNLFTFFIMWEFISVLIYFNIGIFDKRENSGLKYILMNALGGMSLLLAMAMIFNFTGTLNFERLSSIYYLIPKSQAIVIILLFTFAMLIKSAFWGLHTWVKDAYMRSNTCFTAYMSAILSKIGIFGLILLFYKIFPYDYVIQIFTFNNIQLFRIFFTIGGSITAILATIMAIKEQNVKAILTYSSIAQVGYIIASFGLGYRWSIISIMTITTVHLLIKTSLFSDLSFIEYKTGQTDGVELGGLIKVIPFTFVSTLISIIALAGIVPLMGFAAKWIYFENMFISGHYIALIISFLASTLAFLYCYKILSIVFLGIINEKNSSINYFSSLGDSIVTIVNMIIPIALVVFGFYPYPFFRFMFEKISKILPSANVFLSGNFIESSIGYWNPLNTATIVVIIFVSSFIIFVLLMRKPRKVSQYDIAMSAEPVRSYNNLHYVMNFYDGFLEVVKPITSKSSKRFYRKIYGFIEDIGNVLRKLHLNSLTSKNILTGIIILVFIIIIWSAV